jgi:O-antigen biosynthesis protein
MKPEVTIGILTHDRSWHVAQTISAIRQFTREPYVVKLFDISSRPDHAEHVKRMDADDVHVYRIEDFLSCLSGRREILSHVETPFVAYVDDDVRVGPEWLGNLLAPMRTDPEAGAVAANIVQEGQRIESGVRYLERSGRLFEMRNRPANFIGRGDACLGGATLYRTDVLRETEFREEFSGGYEDWDQTLQISRDLKRGVYGSRATVFHRHLPESESYFADRWRWRELFESAFGMLDRWEVRTAVAKVLIAHLRGEIVIPAEFAERIPEIVT